MADIYLDGTKLICASCAKRLIVSPVPVTEERARRHLHLRLGGRLTSISGHELVMRHHPEACEAIYCEADGGACQAELAPDVRECEGCGEFHAWHHGPYCEECARSAESVWRSDMQTAASFGTNGGHP